ncbi:Pyoverdine/dityrosine biosynthesis protein-domain-containing protein, partial [Coniochaeta sp. 2T2.1]
MVPRLMPEIDGTSTTSEAETAQVSARDATDTSSKILAIIYDYALDKSDDTESKHAAGTPKFLSVIDKYVTTGRQVKMCLPAFPFKSANKVHKVFGALPDKAEELALDRLNTMCARIAGVYSPGAKCTIISDGLLYNDREVWAYGESLRAMALQKGFLNIDFARLRDLVDFPFPLPERLDEVTYVANATNFRRCVLNTFGKDDLDIGREIATNQDTLMTYCGYCRFLGSDLQYVFPSASGKMYRKTVKYMARQMLIRGYAFTGALKPRYPDHLRLSIHQSTGEHKVSLSLLNTETGYTTPWHCGVALMADGEWLSGPVGDFKENPRLDVVYEDGRPSYFRERTTE